jgi:hypothetical protein
MLRIIVFCNYDVNMSCVNLQNWPLVTLSNSSSTGQKDYFLIKEIDVQYRFAKRKIYTRRETASFFTLYFLWEFIDRLLNIWYPYRWVWPEKVIRMRFYKANAVSMLDLDVIAVFYYISIMYLLQSQYYWSYFIAGLDNR